MKLFHVFAATILIALAATGNAQQTSAGGAAAPANAAAKPAPSLADLAWLEGCWKGNVNQRDFREVWLPLRGNMMIGVSQTVMNDSTIEYEYLRLEPRADGVYYVAAPGGRDETAFRFSDEADTGDGSRTFVFTHPTRQFPQRISYRRGTLGWLYAEVSGKVDGKDRTVIYPMRRVDCATNELIEK